jgi:hypothetical protein
MTDSQYVRGKILLDESKHPRIVAIRRRDRWLLLAGGLIFIAVAVFSFFRGFAETSWPYSLVEYRFFFILFVTFLFICAYYSLSLLVMKGHLIVYENGILLPLKRRRHIWGFREEFIPFKDIEAIHPNKSRKLSDVVIELRSPMYKGDKRIRRIGKHGNIFSLEEFIRAVRNKADVVDVLGFKNMESETVNLGTGGKMGPASRQSSRMAYDGQNLLNTTIWYDNNRSRNVIKRLLGVIVIVIIIIVASFVSALVFYDLPLGRIIGPMLATIFFPILILIMGFILAVRSPSGIGIDPQSLVLEFMRRKTVIQWSSIKEIVETRKPMHPLEIRCTDGSWVVLTGVSREIIQNIREFHEKTQIARPRK